MHFFKNNFSASKCIDSRELNGNCLLAIICFKISKDVKGEKLPRIVAVRAGLLFLK